MTYWHLHSIDWLSTLPEPFSAQLRDQTAVKTYTEAQMIFAPDPDPDTVFLLEKGIARIYRLSAEGEEFTLTYIGRGEVFGELAAITNRPRESFAQAVTPCTVLSMPRGVFVEAMQAAPQVGFTVSKQIANRTMRIETRAEGLVFHSVAARLAGVLVMLLDDFGDIRDGHATLSLHLTQAEFATLVGAARPTVNQAFQQLRHAGLVQLTRGRITVGNMQSLRDFAHDEG
ncbi:MAG: Crp/Fnr family transcriptional regulator [Paracoccus sp. (in: a-proteobacteria)]|nr:Crp/Fnr family transcriptional regulator [Paracoccus sp. (in: a-proteobacteria)]